MISPWWIVPLAVLGLAVGGLQRAAVFRHSAGYGGPPRTHCPACAALLVPGDGRCAIRGSGRRTTAPRGGGGAAPVGGRGMTVLPFTGRCPACAAAIGPPPLSVESITVLLLAGLAAVTVSAGGAGGAAGRNGGALGACAGELLAFGWLAVLAVPLAFVDTAVRRLPDRLTLPAYAGTLTILAVTAAAVQRPDDALRTVLGGLAMSAFYLLLFLIHPAGIGLGDAKLALALGSALGWLGWSEVLAGLFLTHLFGGLYGAALLALGRAQRGTEIPFGPFMIIGTFAVILSGS
ncbi:prepilin peptidase [Planomonospora sp. ID67723]|uniref:prepilin peptidase n=1 Tax=Planomonospora sp. ID67723 TaxID=2738134 RepID=UPI0018C40AF8|nr:A24 family peptidase [Planomonospora sp. ID67723]MBG0830949.1 prepilin peptidase [Planomonospora sp. ID67723]